MKKASKIILAISIPLALLFLYMTIGYVYRCMSGAYLFNTNGNAHFVGYYMMAAPCGLAFLVFAFLAVYSSLRKK